MAYTFKSKRLGYDNIAAGSAAGFERVIAGGGPGDLTTRESNDTFGVSADCVNSSFITNRPVELELGTALSSDSNHVNSPTSATTPGYTSTTSWTSAINELNTAI